MTIIKNVTDFPENFFGFHPEDLSPDEKNRPLGKIFIKLQKLRNDLGLKCILIPSFLTGNIIISNIKKDEFQTLLQKFGSENYTSASFGEPFSHLTIPI